MSPHKNPFILEVTPGLIHFSSPGKLLDSARTTSNRMYLHSFVCLVFIWLSLILYFANMKKQLLCIKPESNDIAWTCHTQICFGDRIYVTLADEDAFTKCCCLSVICQPDNRLTTKFSTLDPFCPKHFVLFFGIFESGALDCTCCKWCTSCK